MSSTSAEKTTEADVSPLTNDEVAAIVNAGRPERPPRESDRWQEGDPRRRRQKLESAAQIAWSKEPEAIKSARRQTILIYAVIAVFIVTFCATFVLIVSVGESWHDWSPVPATGAVIELCLGALFYIVFLIREYRYRAFEKSYLATAEEQSRTGTAEGQPEPIASLPKKKWLSDPEFENLLLVNTAQLNVYQDIATRDARAASWHSRTAILAGFVILVAGAVGAIWAAHDSTSKIVVGALASLGSILSGYISQTFLKAQAQARKQLNYYFHQPLVTSYLLSAERIALKLGDDSSTRKALLDMIKSVLLAEGRAEEPDSAPSGPPRRRYRRAQNAADAPKQESQAGS